MPETINQNSSEGLNLAFLSIKEFNEKIANYNYDQLVKLKTDLERQLKKTGERYLDLNENASKEERENLIKMGTRLEEMIEIVLKNIENYPQ